MSATVAGVDRLVLEDVLAGLTREQLDSIKADRSADIELRFAAADELGLRNRAAIDAAHAAQHGRVELRYGRVEARRGYRGQVVCLDCYYGRPAR